MGPAGAAPFPSPLAGGKSGPVSPVPTGVEAATNGGEDRTDTSRKEDVPEGPLAEEKSAIRPSPALVTLDGV